MNGTPTLLDVVELRKSHGRVPAGVVGTVVELSSTAALVEIADESGATVEILTVPLEELRVRSSAPARRRAAG